MVKLHHLPECNYHHHLSQQFCLQSDHLSVYKRPRYYRFVKELPMTATGKLQHYLVKEMALSDMEAGRLKLAMKKEG